MGMTNDQKLELIEWWLVHHGNVPTGFYGLAQRKQNWDDEVVLKGEIDSAIFLLERHGFKVVEQQSEAPTVSKDGGSND